MGGYKPLTSSISFRLNAYRLRIKIIYIPTYGSTKVGLKGLEPAASSMRWIKMQVKTGKEPSNTSNISQNHHIVTTYLYPRYSPICTGMKQETAAHRPAQGQIKVSERSYLANYISNFSRINDPVKPRESPWVGDSCPPLGGQARFDLP